MTKTSILKDVLEDAHRGVMRQPAWMRRNDPNFIDERPLDERVVDFLDCNSGVAFTFDAIADHMNCCGGVERNHLHGVIQMLVLKEKINNFFHQRESIHFYTSKDRQYQP